MHPVAVWMARNAPGRGFLAVVVLRRPFPNLAEVLAGLLCVVAGGDLPNRGFRCPRGRFP